MVSETLENKIDQALEMFGKLEKLMEKAGDISKISKDVEEIKTNHLKHIEERLTVLELGQKEIKTLLNKILKK